MHLTVQQIDEKIEEYQLKIQKLKEGRETLRALEDEFGDIVEKKAVEKKEKATTKKPVYTDEILKVFPKNKKGYTPVTSKTLAEAYIAECQKGEEYPITKAQIASAASKVLGDAARGKKPESFGYVVGRVDGVISRPYQYTVTLKTPPKKEGPKHPKAERNITIANIREDTPKLVKEEVGVFTSNTFSKRLEAKYACDDHKYVSSEVCKVLKAMLKERVIEQVGRLGSCRSYRKI